MNLRKPLATLLRDPTAHPASPLPMLREKYIHMPNWNAPRNIHPKWLAPTSRAFPLDWQPDPGDFDDLLAALIENACYLIRRRDGQLRAHATLSGLTAYCPNGRRTLGEMGADELARLVVELREQAAAAREKAQSAA